jgi:hypothetical protein
LCVTGVAVDDVVVDVVGVVVVVVPDPDVVVVVVVEALQTVMLTVWGNGGSSTVPAVGF